MSPDPSRVAVPGGTDEMWERFAGLGFARLDEEGRVLTSNARWRDLSGLSEEDVPGAPWHASAHTDDRGRVHDVWAVARTSGESLRLGLRFVHADGRTTRGRVELVPDGAGGWLAAIVGGGARQRARDEELFRQLTLNIREVFWLTDWRTRQVLFVSPVYETTWKRSCTSLYADGASWADPIHPEDRARVVEAFRRDAERGAYGVEYRILWPDGTVRWIYDRAFPIRDERGEVVRMAGISEDITERKRIESELAGARDEARRRFQELAENITEVFWLTAADFSHSIYVSPAYERVWGRSAQSLYQNPTDWIDAIVPEDRERVLECFHRDARQGDYDTEYRITRPSGEVRWIHDRGYVVRDEAGDPVRIAGFALDVTERKQAEAKLRTLASELELAEERERRRLAQDLHDGLNQLLTLARMKLGALRASAGEELGGELGRISELVDLANRSVRSLTFQLSPPVLHDFGLEAAVEWLAEDVHANHGLEVRVERPEDPLEMDERVRILVFRAVRELLINAAKHACATRVDVRVRRAEAGLEVVVADDGRAFEPGCQPISGFGLYSIRERLGHLGGRLEIHAEPGAGTTVVLECPLAFPASEAGSQGEDR